MAFLHLSLTRRCGQRCLISSFERKSLSIPSRAEGNKSKGEYVGMKGFAGSRSVALHNAQSVVPNFFSFLGWKHNWALGAKRALRDISSLLGDRKWVIQWWVMSNDISVMIEIFFSSKQPLNILTHMEKMKKILKKLIVVCIQKSLTLGYTTYTLNLFNPHSFFNMKFTHRKLTTWAYVTFALKKNTNTIKYSKSIFKWMETILNK